MVIVSIVYHSGYGHTAEVAKHVQAGLNSVSGVQARIYTADEAVAKLDELDSADALVFGAPTYMGGPAAAFKAFADATSKKWYARAWKDKLAAGFTNSGGMSGDKQVTLQYFVTLAMQHGMLWIGQGELAAAKAGDPEGINRISSYTGLMTQADQAPPAQSPPAGDRKTAELFGQRIGAAALRWSRGKT
jgi:NAD(P)H dehydrogenase (quinone)